MRFTRDEKFAIEEALIKYLEDGVKYMSEEELEHFASALDKISLGSVTWIEEE